MDLLLYLVEKDEIDIYDIPIAAISDQYIFYLQGSNDFDLERLGDFLLMASYLLNLKSRLLLPRTVLAEMAEEDELTDPREELAQRLLAYKRFKEAADYLDSMQEGERPRIFYHSPSDEILGREELSVDLKALLRAYRFMLQDIPAPGALYELPQEDFNVEEKMEEIIARLEGRPGGVVFQDLFTGVRYRREAYALFLALLELLRLQRVIANQTRVFGQIIIYGRGEDEAC